METQIDIKQIRNYVLIPLIIGTVTAILPSIFIFTGIAQFIIGAIQVLIAFAKTITCAVEGNRLPKVMRTYWTWVFSYFAIGTIGYTIANHFNSTNDTWFLIGLIYLSLAWGIAVYHYKHIMFLKIKNH